MLDRIVGTGEEMLLNLLNQTNQTNYTQNDIEFDNPEAISDDGFNTRVRVRGGKTSVFYDERYVRYNRLNLGEFFALYRSHYDVLPGSYTTDDIVDFLNDTYGGELRPSDFEYREIEVESGSQNVLELLAKSDSLLFTGSAFITLEHIAPPVEEEDMHYMALIANMSVNLETNGSEAEVSEVWINFTDGSYVTEFIAFSSDPSDDNPYSVDDLSQLELISGEMFHAVHNEYSAAHALRLTQYLVGNSDGGFRRHFNGPRTKVADLVVQSQNATTLQLTATNTVTHERQGGDNAYAILLKFNHPDLDAPIYVCSTHFNYYSNW